MVTSALFAQDDKDPFLYWILPSSLAVGGTLVALLYVLVRSKEGQDNLIYQDYLTRWVLSGDIFVTFIYTFVGITTRAVATVPLVSIFNLMDLAENIYIASQYPGETPGLRLFGGVATGLFTHCICFVRAYHTELIFRGQFDGLKRAQTAIRRLALIEESVKSLLENILPKSVIPRLIASNFQFSTVTDRYDKSYCMFVEFFKSGAIKGMAAEFVALTLNRTFAQMDGILTIGSKCLLLAIAREEKNQDLGETVTELAKAVFRTFHASTSLGISIKCDIKIGIAFGSVVAELQWRSKGYVNIKGKGDMIVYELEFNAEELPVYQFANVEENQQKSNTSTLQNFRSSISSLKRASITTADFVTKSERASTAFRKMNKVVPTIISTATMPLSETTVVPLETRVPPTKIQTSPNVDFSKYLTSQLSLNDLKPTKHISSGLQDVIHHIAPLLETSTTDTLKVLLSPHVVRTSLKFRDIRIERFFQKSAKHLLDGYILHHGRAVCAMMIGFFVLVMLYEIFLVGQVGIPIELEIRNATATKEAETKMQESGRFISLATILLTASLQILAVLMLAVDVYRPKVLQPLENRIFGKGWIFAEGTLHTLQDNFDARAFLSAGLLKAVVPKRIIIRLSNISLDSEDLTAETFSTSLGVSEADAKLSTSVSIGNEILSASASNVCQNNGGLSKLKYELIGETIDVAELIQEKADPGAVAVSKTTLSLITPPNRFSVSKLDKLRVPFALGTLFPSPPLPMWETAVTTNKYTLKFPNDEEKIFLQEHCGSQNGRRITTFLYVLTIQYAALYSISSALIATDDEDPFQYWIIVLVITVTILGFGLSKRFRDLDDAYTRAGILRRYTTNGCKFSGLKMAQRAIQRIAIIERTMESLLENSLPKSVIPRLIASEFKFSTVSDRIDHAYCIFIDCFDSAILKNLDAAIAAEALNETFSILDDILVNFPIIEKIKTITSKCLLMVIAESATSIQGDAITTFFEQVYLRYDGKICKLAKTRAMIPYRIRIGVAFGAVVAGIVGEDRFIYDIYSDTVNCESLWRSVGIMDVKGKGKMEVFTLADIELNDVLPMYTSPIFNETASYSKPISSGILGRRRSIFKQIQPGVAFLVSPLPSFPTPIPASRGSSFFHSSEQGVVTLDFDIQPTKPLHSLVNLKDSSLKSQVVPVDMTKYLNASSVTLDSKPKKQWPALEGIINELAPIIETSTTDSLLTLLSQHISRWTLKFKAKEIEMKYRNSIKGRLLAHALQHSKGICYMMVGTAVIALLYEVFLVGQVGFLVEQEIREGKANTPFETPTDHRDRYITAAGMVFGAVMQIVASLTLSFDVLGGRDNQINVKVLDKRKPYLSTFHYLKRFFGSSEEPKEGHIQYAIQVSLVTLFGVSLLAKSTYSKAWWAVGAICPMLDSAISFTSGVSIDFRTRLLSSVTANLIICITRNIVEALGYAEWLFALASILTSMFIVYQTEYSEKIGFLLEETLTSLQATFDRRAFVSGGLLKAVVPKRLINRLAVNSDESTIVEQFSMVTILHLDVVSFTVLSGTLQPIELINLLNAIFSTFDQICKIYDVEKILTIGDAYVAAKLGEDIGGNGQDKTTSPKKEYVKDSDVGLNANAVCLVSLDMQRALVSRKGEFQGVQIRVGIHSGPVSGFITGGNTKLKYELIGETVDLAEKVQEKAHPGSVFASLKTVSILPPSCSFECRDTGIHLAETQLHLWELVPLV
ncbi:hypothetical protein HDU76_000550 [Blyttiomyces sp. JEL0837]|nr:hypothetical protein HDU76_000550 [Blyttiomyces sp. JEL0837]